MKPRLGDNFKLWTAFILGFASSDLYESTHGFISRWERVLSNHHIYESSFVFHECIGCWSRPRIAFSIHDFADVRDRELPIYLIAWIDFAEILPKISIFVPTIYTLHPQTHYHQFAPATSFDLQLPFDLSIGEDSYSCSRPMCSLVTVHRDFSQMMWPHVTVVIFNPWALSYNLDRFTYG